MVTLAGVERKTGAVMATAVPTKGSTGRFSVDKVLEFMDEVGDQAVEVIVKSDQLSTVKVVMGLWKGRSRRWRGRCGQLCLRLKTG